MTSHPKSDSSVPESKLAKAILCATLSHDGQVDKSGQPYILHPLSVLFRVRRAGESEEVQIAAVLHDTVEDTPLTLAEIEQDFGEAVAVAVDALTRRAGEVYQQYLIRLAANPIAKIVKLEDLHDNLDPQRHSWAKDSYTIAKLERLRDRYLSALQLLSKPHGARLVRGGE